MTKCNFKYRNIRTAAIFVFACVLYTINAQARVGTHCELTKTAPTARELKVVKDILDKGDRKNKEPFVLRVRVLWVSSSSPNSRETVLTLLPIEIVSGKASIPSWPFQILFKPMAANAARPLTKKHLGTQWYLTAAMGVDSGSGKPLNDKLGFQSFSIHRQNCSQPLHIKQ